jgi:hypothetical protein
VTQNESVFASKAEAKAIRPARNFLFLPRFSLSGFYFATKNYCDLDAVVNQIPLIARIYTFSMFIH